MSFRIEYKLFINKENVNQFKSFLFKKNTKRLYETRNVESLYFDNKNKDMFNDSIEGLTPRKKIRIRYYPKSKSKDLNLEKKISSVEGRFKLSKKINQKIFKKIKRQGIYDSQYGWCHPLILVTYKREYFKLGNTRITIDNNINYKNFDNSSIKKDKDIIVEIKSNFLDQLENIQKKFPFQNIRFSKYCNGVSVFFNV